MFAISTICLALFAVASPADEVRAAAADIQHVPLDAQPATRYLTLYAIDPSQRHAATQIVSYVLNALSTARAISSPAFVTPTLIRFNINQYAAGQDELTAWTAAWEKLAEADLYFHLRADVLIPSPKENQKPTTNKPPPTTNQLHSANIKTITTDGGWADLSAAAQLRSATHSIGALLRADYFIAQATTTPRYYEFASVPNTENEFLKSLGVDRVTIDRLHANAGANLVLSGVTAKPRRIVWAQGPLGGVYSTLDVEQIDAQRDPIRRPITAAGLAFQYDLGEWFALAPNGLWRTALFNAAGHRQDSVPDRVAKDTSDPAGDGIVIPLISCIRCHREAGLRPFADDETKLLSGHVNLYSPDPNIVERAVEFYDQPRLQRQMEFDRQTYTDSVSRAAAGLKPTELADSLAALFRQYTYLPVTLPQAAAEVGLTPTAFQQALSATRDPVILLLLENRAVLRGQWESSFAEAALTAETYRANSTEHQTSN